jgi:hypothetical protein
MLLGHQWSEEIEDWVHGTVDLIVVRHLCHFMYGRFKLHPLTFASTACATIHNAKEHAIYSLPPSPLWSTTVDTSTTDLTVVRHLCLVMMAVWLIHTIFSLILKWNGSGIDMHKRLRWCSKKMCYLYYFDTCNFALISYLQLLMHVLFHFVRFKDGYFSCGWSQMF